MSSALQDTDDTQLGKAIAPLAAAHPGKSGIHPLADARDAFTARMRLAAVAQRSLDIQYYIWRKDMTGTLMFDALREAADRGVRVRLLLDDNNTSGLDATLAALDAHPHIEVRLFNPFPIRSPRWIGYLTDFSRLNRRMHNKSFTADNQATIIGGRNVGDEYFGASDGILFADLDVLAVGPVVDDVSRDFDRYWASQSSYPVQRLLAPATAETHRQFDLEVQQVRTAPVARAYLDALRNSDFFNNLTQGQLQFEWAETRMVSDDPAKALGLADKEALLPEQLNEIIGRPETEVKLVSPYFVPTSAGVAAFANMATRGVEVRVLTNALEATDVVPVHAGYAKHRKALLRAGIKLFESRRTPGDPAGQSAGPFGSSASSLHAKTFSVDRDHLFIGSFNFDPRSAKLNTEMGFVIDSPTMASQIDDALGKRMPALAYEVRLSESGDLYWLEHRNGEVIRHETEPGTSFWQRLAVRILAALPIDWLL